MKKREGRVAVGIVEITAFLGNGKRRVVRKTVYREETAGKKPAGIFERDRESGSAHENAQQQISEKRTEMNARQEERYGEKSGGIHR